MRKRRGIREGALFAVRLGAHHADTGVSHGKGLRRVRRPDPGADVTFVSLSESTIRLDFATAPAAGRVHLTLLKA